MVDENNPYAPPTVTPDRAKVDWLHATDLRVVRVLLYIHALTVAVGWLFGMRSLLDTKPGPLIFMMTLVSPAGMLFAAMRLEDRPVPLRFAVVLVALTLSALQLLCAAYR